MIKLFIALVILFALGLIFFIAILAGETYALENKHPRFTRWWRKHMVGEWRD